MSVPTPETTSIITSESGSTRSASLKLSACVSTQPKAVLTVSRLLAWRSSVAAKATIAAMKETAVEVVAR